MPSSDLAEAQGLLERAERETDAARKFAALEEGIDLLEAYVDNTDVSDFERTRAMNLRRTNVRRLLSQLVDMRNIQLNGKRPAWALLLECG